MDRCGSTTGTPRASVFNPVNQVKTGECTRRGWRGRESVEEAEEQAGPGHDVVLFKRRSGANPHANVFNPVNQVKMRERVRRG